MCSSILRPFSKIPTIDATPASIFVTAINTHSQVFDPTAHVQSVTRVVEAMKRLREELGFRVWELNMGGGFGARSHPSEPSVPLKLFTDAMMEALQRACEAGGLEILDVSIEPGR